jgi:uncharacterized protein (DUF2141 family)
MHYFRAFILLVSISGFVKAGLLFSSKEKACLTSNTSGEVGSIEVPIENLRNFNQGQLIVGLFGKTSRVDFKLPKAIQHKIVTVKSSKTSVTFDNVPHGEYAVCAIHDVDSNKKLNQNFIGVPIEDIGTTNNVKGGPMGGPKWDVAKVTLQGKKLVVTPLKMVHM